MPFEQLTQPRQLGIKALVAACSRLAATTLLIAPMRRNTIFTDAMHLEGADLNLQRLTTARQHRRMQRLIHIRFWHSNIILEASRNRTPHAVDNTQRTIAVLDRIDQHADSQKVINLAQLLVVTQHFLMNAVEILRTALNLAANARLFHGILQRRHRLINHGLALTAFNLYLLHEVIINIRLHITERQILQLPLNRVDTEAVRQRSINLQRFLRNRLLLMHRHELHRAHIVQTVGQLNQNDTDIARHRQEHLAIVLNLAVLLRDIFNFAQLRNTVNQICYDSAKLLLNIVELIIRIFDYVMQKGSCQRFFVHLQADKNTHHANRVNDIRLAGLALLLSVRLCRQLICLADKGNLLRTQICFYALK